MVRPASVRAWRPDVSAELDAVIMKCLRRVPEERFASVTELAFALAPFGTSVSVTACASSNRILPLASAPPVARVEEAEKIDAPISATLFGPPPPRPETHPSADAPRTVRRSLAQQALLAGLVIALAVIGWLLVARMRAGTVPTAPRADVAAAVPLSSPSVVTTSPENAPQNAAPVLASESGAPAPSQIPAPSSGRTKGAAAPGASARPIAVVTTKPASPSCEVPYEIDAEGKKIWKRECL